MFNLVIIASNGFSKLTNLSIDKCITNIFGYDSWNTYKSLIPYRYVYLLVIENMYCIQFENVFIILLCVIANWKHCLAKLNIYEAGHSKGAFTGC